MKSILRATCAIALLLVASATATAEIIRIATVGDSLTLQWSPKLGPAISNAGYSADVTQCARGGLSALNLTSPTDYVQMAIDSDPDVICFMLGVNDAWPDWNKNDRWNLYKPVVSEAFDRFAAAVNSAGNHPTVIVSTVLPFDLEKNQIFENSTGNSGALDRIENWYRPWLTDQATARGFVVLDLWSEIQQQPNWMGAMFGVDGLHLSAAGSDWVASEFAGATISTVPEPSSIAMWLAVGVAGVGYYWRRRRTS